MNFLEFLTEESQKELYTIVNTRDGSVPDKDGEVYQTWAVSPEKAKWQIIHRLKEEPDKYAWKVINNSQDYEPITWDRYKEMTMEKKPALPEPGPVKMKEDPQMTLFNDPVQTPY